MLFNKFRGRDFESHWKNFHMVKKVLEDRLHQNKSHLRYTLIDRVMLHQEFRNESRTCSFTETHKQIILDLFELSVSHYSEVSSNNQYFKIFFNISFSIVGSNYCSKQTFCYDCYISLFIPSFNTIYKGNSSNGYNRTS